METRVAALETWQRDVANPAIIEGRTIGRVLVFGIPVMLTVAMLIVGIVALTQ